MESEVISSATNKDVKHIKKLISSSKYRREYKQFVVEGLRAVKEVPKDLLSAVYYAGDMGAFEFISSPDVKVYEMSESLMASISATKHPQGILALCDMPKQEAFNPTASDRVLVLDRVNDPGNLGTIIRSARASDVDYLVLLKGSVDIYNDKVVRSTMGGLFKQRIITGLSPTDIKENVKTDIYAAVLEDARTYYECDLSGGFCLILGNEANGISEEVEAIVTKRITIPMSENTESLNLGVSAGVLLFEAKRQRDSK